MYILFLYIFIVSLLIPSYALAWGTGMHIAEGLFILKNLYLFSPAIMKILSVNHREYLYGCIGADIFIGKGYKKKEDHCHNWDVGIKMLKSARTDTEKAFSYGYMSHLASDIIAHNYYIPNQLYLTSSTKKLGHIYWEFRSDAFLNSIYLQIAMDIISEANNDIDTFLQKIVAKKIIPFDTKKMIYSNSIKMRSLTQWQRAQDTIAKNSRWDINLNYIKNLHTISLKVIADMLINQEKAVCFRYDPIGADNFFISKKMRRKDKHNGTGQVLGLFDIPEDILSIKTKGITDNTLLLNDYEVVTRIGSTIIFNPRN